MSHLTRNATAARQRMEARVASRLPRMPSGSQEDSLLDEEAPPHQEAPSRYWPVRPTWLALLWQSIAVLIVTLCNLIMLVPLSLLWPLAFVENRIWRAHYRNTAWRRTPESMRVAVIGAGWGGLQTAARLVEHGADVEVFETRDDVGGTWHPGHRPEGLRLHTPAWAAGFVGFAPPERDTGSGQGSSTDFRPAGATVFDYVQRFAAHAGLTDRIHTCSAVQAMDYDSTHRTGTLSVQNLKTGVQQQHGPYDMIVHTSLASDPKTPMLEGADEFTGLSVHSSQLSRELLEALLADDRRLVVVGGSKSACDAIVALTDAHVDMSRVTWLYRRPYQFCKVERYFHDRSWLSTLRGYVAYHAFKLGWPLSRASDGADGYVLLSWLLLWLLDYGWTYDSDPWSLPLRSQPGALATLGREWAHFHIGMLDARERLILASHRGKVRGSPAKFEPDGLVLEDGTRIGADVVVWATGYSTGMDKMAFCKDGEPVSYTHLRAHETVLDLVCRLLLEKKKHHA
eukprot:TRINITY_DN14864_c0_g1_i1.p1 TRINITY_DN14864_c0_g1~~TRINITY_DN14864_c0_g1_i1.p1  ORF type:complete len:512 (-),score=78.95 TRINITY_DN14864_c0_g1_i1:12-1547(-)